MNYTTPQAHPVAVENIGRALLTAFDMSNEAVRKHITAYSKPRTKENKAALHLATDDANEAYKAYLYISHLHDRIWRKYIDGALTVDRLDDLRDAIDAADQIDMMRTP